jgi:hypothetical protein
MRRRHDSDRRILRAGAKGDKPTRAQGSDREAPGVRTTQTLARLDLRGRLGEIGTEFGDMPYADIDWPHRRRGRPAPPACPTAPEALVSTSTRG